MAAYFQKSQHGLTLENDVVAPFRDNVVPVRADPGSESTGRGRVDHCTRALYFWMIVAGLMGLALLIIASWMIGLGFFIVLATLCSIAGGISPPEFMLGERYLIEDSDWLDLPRAA